MEEWDMKVDITRKNGHYEVYINDEFICSADTAVEAAQEADVYLERFRSGVV